MPSPLGAPVRPTFVVASPPAHEKQVQQRDYNTLWEMRRIYHWPLFTGVRSQVFFLFSLNRTISRATLALALPIRSPCGDQFGIRFLSPLLVSEEQRPREVYELRFFTSTSLWVASLISFIRHFRLIYRCISQFVYLLHDGVGVCNVDKLVRDWTVDVVECTMNKWMTMNIVL